MAAGYLLLALTVALAVYLWLRTGDNANRLQALKRLALGIPYFIAMFLLGAVFGGIIILLWLVDVTWQFTTGRSGFTGNGYADRLWNWKDENTRYIIHGDGDPRLLP